MKLCLMHAFPEDARLLCGVGAVVDGDGDID
jgi:hypothetical protein